MDPQKKWKRLNNPRCLKDWGLSLSESELMSFPEGRKIVREANLFGVILDQTKKRAEKMMLLEELREFMTVTTKMPDTGDTPTKLISVEIGYGVDDPARVWLRVPVEWACKEKYAEYMDWCWRHKANVTPFAEYLKTLGAVEDMGIEQWDKFDYISYLE